MVSKDLESFSIIGDKAPVDARVVGGMFAEEDFASCPADDMLVETNPDEESVVDWPTWLPDACCAGGLDFGAGAVDMTGSFALDSVPGVINALVVFFS